jgi:tRNA nucleotidyltransferase (CCA-adding enzyme)
MPDYMFLLESRLSPEQRAAMLRVQELAAAMGFNVYLTGGTVRDLITGATLRDLDFTVEGNPSKMARELEKGGATILAEDEKLRTVELLFGGEWEGSISAARDDHYVRPGTRPEIRWSTIMEDLRRRDFSPNAIAISLNPASRGLLLDPTNGLSDIEHGEVRALTIHSFTNRPVRLLRAIRLAARMGFKMESRTQEWFNLAIERELEKTIEAEDAGEELRSLSKEERPHLALKEWEEGDLLERVHPLLAKKKPDYEAINRLIKVRDDLFMAGFRPGLGTPMLLAILGKMKDRELSSLLSKMGWRSAEIDAVESFPEKALAAQKELTGKKTATPIDAYRYIEKMPMEYVAYLLAESNNSAAISKLKAFLNKWRPIRQALPVVSNELEQLGMPRGPKFDQVVQDVFAAQLNGRGKTPEERVKMLRKLSGIKELPKKKEKEKKPGKVAAAEKAVAVAAIAAKSAAGARGKPGGAAYAPHAVHVPHGHGQHGHGAGAAGKKKGKK